MNTRDVDDDAGVLLVVALVIFTLSLMLFSFLNHFCGARECIFLDIKNENENEKK